MWRLNVFTLDNLVCQVIIRIQPKAKMSLNKFLKELVKKTPEKTERTIIFDKISDNSRVYLSLSALALLIFLAIALNFPIKDFFLRRFFPKQLSQAAGNYSISGHIFLDANNNGIEDPEDIGVFNGGDAYNVGINLLDSTGALISSLATDSLGNFSFSNLAPGGYTLSLQLSTGMSVSRNGSSTIPITLSSTNTNPNISLGIIWQPGSNNDPACQVAWVKPQAQVRNWVPFETATLNSKSGYYSATAVAPDSGVTPTPAWTGVSQLYASTSAISQSNPNLSNCISCNTPATGSPEPQPDRYKYYDNWIPGTDWLTAVGEGPDGPYIHWATASAGLQAIETNGEYGNLFAVSPNIISPTQSQWYNLTNYLPDFSTKGPTYGVLSPKFTSDGKIVMWDKIVPCPTCQSNISSFGFWQLHKANIAIPTPSGSPQLQNDMVIPPSPTPGFYEISDFSQNNQIGVFATDLNLTNGFGLEEYLINFSTNQITNLTNSPDHWDEHMFFSPSGKKVAWSSDSPFPSMFLPTTSDCYNSHKTWPSYRVCFHPEATIADFNASTANIFNEERATYFNSPPPFMDTNAHSEYIATSSSALADVKGWSQDGSQIQIGSSYVNPNTQLLYGGGSYIVQFAGTCGGTDIVNITLTPTPTSAPISTPTPTLTPMPSVTISPTPTPGVSTPTQPVINTPTPTATVIPSITTTFSNGDLNNDGSVGLDDLSILLSDFNTNQPLDLDGDNIINSVDFEVMLTNLKNIGVIE